MGLQPSAGLALLRHLNVRELTANFHACLPAPRGRCRPMSGPAFYTLSPAYDKSIFFLFHGRTRRSTVQVAPSSSKLTSDIDTT